MKRTLALTVVTALCAVSPFVAGAAMSSLQQPGADAPATSYDGAQAEYILRDYEGYVSVFASDADRRPLQVTGIEVAGLRRADQELLRGGITDPDFGIILLKIMEENGEELFGSIDDDDELDKVYNYYMEEIFADEDEESDGGAEE